MKKIVGIIPARYGSSRFPGKPLHRIGGKPLVQHVWERCVEAAELSAVVVATDDERIAEAARGFGAEVAITRGDHPSGTDRIAEAAGALEDPTHVINIQGDEPLIAPRLIDALAAALAGDPDLEMVTAATPLDPGPDFLDPNIVKVVLARDGHALYFSRSPIPNDASASAPLFRHKGIYGYRADFLQQFVRWRPSPLERAERLEQLRALENGARIRVLITDEPSIGVDTPEQAAYVEKLLAPASA